MGYDELGPFQLADGVKINPKIYCQILYETFFKHWYKKKSTALKKFDIHASKDSTERARKAYSKLGPYAA